MQNPWLSTKRQNNKAIAKQKQPNRGYVLPDFCAGNDEVSRHFPVSGTTYPFTHITFSTFVRAYSAETASQQNSAKRGTQDDI